MRIIPNIRIEKNKEKGSSGKNIITPNSQEITDEHKLGNGMKEDDPIL